MATAVADAMDMDMDIDIDLGDMGDAGVLEDSIQPTVIPESSGAGFTTRLPTQLTSDATIQDTTREEEELVPNKINVQGVDDLSTSDLEIYVAEYFPGHKPKTEWINDTSVNFAFEDEEVALQALASLTSTDALESDNRRQRAAKPVTSHPGARLLVRLTLVTDKKKPRAREASRYYLLHPEEEEQERQRKRAQRRRRRSDDEVETFEASMYDDDEDALATRRGNRTRSMDRRRNRNRSASPARSASPGRRRGYGRDREPRRSRNSGKELFAKDPALRAANNKAAAGNLKKELFPLRTGSKADETADLFASKLSLPMVDGAAGADDFPLRSDAMYQQQQRQEKQGFAIKGTASSNDDPQGFSIRGAAGQRKTLKELFPERSNGNAGKELFGGGRVPRRNKAADLFG